MILSASRRTDIPCYYSEWFMNRLRAGYVLVRNPMNHAQISKIILTPDIVDCIVFWTKDPLHLMPYLQEIDSMGYSYYFQFTITPYGKELEQNLRPKTQIMDTFIALSERIGKDRVVWRYDPIILNSAMDIPFHMEVFEEMSTKLSSYTDMAVISFVDMYPKLHTPLVQKIDHDQMPELAAQIARIGLRHGIQVTACCEQIDLSLDGVVRSSCIDRTRIERIIGCPLDVKEDRNQRSGCGCYESIDIGAYDTCGNGCVYCYANRGANAAIRNLERHDPEGEFLIGFRRPDELIKERKVISNRIKQIGLF